MAHENIQFTEPHVAIVDGYFYTFDTVSNILIKKVDDSAVSFTYPILNSIGTTVNSLEHDGQYFWTLQDGSNPGWDVTLKKWAIDGYFCNLKDTIEINYDGSDRYDSSAFTIEHYHTSFSTTVSGNSSYVCLSDYANNTDIVSPGTVLTLGPNSDGNYEDVTVTGTISGDIVGLNFFTLYPYEDGDPINISKYIWLFNNYNGVQTDGALYKFDAHSGVYINRYDGSEYGGVDACTFEKITEVSQFDEIYSLLYVSSTYVRFLDVSSNDSISTYCSMIIDNLQANGSTVINVYDLAIQEGSIYRLQRKANYYGVDSSWATYNYQLSPLRNFIDSITLSVYPNILPTTGLNVAEAIAVIKDQFSESVVSKPVYFSDDDAVGFMTISPRLTDNSGVAISYYQSGISVGVVTITAEVTQFD